MDEQYRLWCGKWIACQMLSGSDLIAISELGRPPAIEVFTPPRW